MATTTKYLYFLVLLCGFFSRTVTGIDLTADGGYSFTLAVDSDTPEPANVEQYIGNLKRSLQEFSNDLFKTTDRFHVKSVDILVPDTWETLEDAENADVTASYETSEVRLSDQIRYASVENPNPCGLPGDHISLPATFFSDGQYGLAWKALLPLWARYRWGVWEEHGHASSSRYPYFSKADVYSQEWTATGCSDEPLTGRFLDQNGDQCVLDPTTLPEEGCRFHPAPGFQNSATSSLMHFHWLDSVTKFCDENTHNHFSPNRQNMLCNQKSVLRILRESSDFEAVTSPPPEPIELIQFRTVKPNTTPYIYFLVDKARPEVDISIVNAVFHGLVSKFFQPNDLPSVVAGLGTFPVTRPVDGANLNAEIAFTELESSLDEFVMKLGSLNTGGDEVRDFATPIIDVVRMVRAKRPVGGGVIFLLKTGGADLTPLMAYEEETAAILRNEQIKLISLELGSTHLENFSEKSGSILRSVNSLSEVDDTIDELLELVKEELDKKVDTPAQNVESLFRGNVPANNDLEVSIPEHISNVEIHLVLPSNAGGTSQIRVAGTVRPFVRGTDWSMSGTSGSRQVLSVIPPLDANDESVWTFRYECGGSNCATTGHFLIYGVSDRSSGLLSADKDIQIAVSTSARQPDHVVDFSKTLSTLSPFGIYAKVTQAGVPVRNVIVVAHIEDQEDGTIYDVPLSDNGFGTPDVDVNDGIYSGNFIPAKDGEYKVYVSAENSRGRNANGVVTASTSLSQRLLPIDQTEPERDTVEVDGEFLQNAQLPEMITVINTGDIPENFEDKPFMILDLTAQPNEGGITVSFTVPQAPGSASPLNLQYDVYASVTDSLELILPNQAGEEVPGSPELRRILVSRALYQGKEFVAVKSKNGVIESEFSTIIKIGEELDDSTTEPPTTESPGPSSPPTTEGSTEPPTTGASTESPPTGPTDSPTTLEPTEPPTPGPTDPPTTGGPTNPPVTGPTTSEEPPTSAPDDDKPFFKTAGGIVVIVLIVLILAGAVGGGAFFYMKRKNRAMDFGKLMEGQERHAEADNDQL